MIVGVLALVAAGGGAAIHWAQTPPPATINPDDALADVDPPPSAVREGELKRQLRDKAIRLDIMSDDLRDLAELYLKDRRFDEALKLFDPEAVRKLGAVQALAKEPAREREQVTILCGLGRAVVLAYEDKAEESNAELLKLVKAYPPPKKDSAVPKGQRSGGQLEQFFTRTEAGTHWKRAVGEALDRNEKNLGGKLPDELKRLRLLPAKGKG